MSLTSWRITLCMHKNIAIQNKKKVNEKPGMMSCYTEYKKNGLYPLRWGLAKCLSNRFWVPLSNWGTFLSSSTAKNTLAKVKKTSMTWHTAVEYICSTQTLFPSIYCIYTSHMDSLGWLVAIHDCLASLISQQIIIKHHATFQLGAPSKSTLKNISMKLQTHDVDTAIHIGTYSWEVMETYITWQGNRLETLFANLCNTM